MATFAEALHLASKWGHIFSQFADCNGMLTINLGQDPIDLDDSFRKMLSEARAEIPQILTFIENASGLSNEIVSTERLNGY